MFLGVGAIWGAQSNMGPMALFWKYRICFSSYIYSYTKMMVFHNNTGGGLFMVFRSLGSKVQDGPYGPGSSVGPMAQFMETHKMLPFLQIGYFCTIMVFHNKTNWLSFQGVQEFGVQGPTWTLWSRVQCGPSSPFVQNASLPTVSLV